MSGSKLQVQTYNPYRTQILGRDQLRDMSKLNPWIPVRDTAWFWLQIVAAWIVVAEFPEWWMVLAAIPFVGTRYYALYIIGHDGLHRRLFPSVMANDLWNDALILGPIGAITRLNRLNHMVHHETLALASDPDRYKYRSADKSTPFRMLAVLTGLPYVLRAVSNVFHLKKPIAAGSEGYHARDVIILAGWQGALISGLSLGVGWWGYPMLWLLPVYAFTFTADIVRVFLEHSRPGDDDEGDRTMRLTTYISSKPERIFFAPQNMNFHAAHHLWPSIPYYNLPRADLLMRQSPHRDAGLLWRSSYLGYLHVYWRQLKAGSAVP